MKYVSIDIETTGLSEKEHQILEFAAIIEDSNNPLPFEKLPKFRRIVLNMDERYVFSSYACNMNKRLVEIISNIENGKKYEPEPIENTDDGVCFEHLLGIQFLEFLEANGIDPEKVNAAGKNFKGFDEKFLKQLSTFNNGNIKFNYRGLDPASIFIDWNNDFSSPSTETCKQRAGLSKEVSHEALQDAWDIIQLFRFDKKQKEELATLRKRFKPTIEEIS